jgi:hypothetical protein
LVLGSRIVQKILCRWSDGALRIPMNRPERRHQDDDLSPRIREASAVSRMLAAADVADGAAFGQSPSFSIER